MVAWLKEYVIRRAIPIRQLLLGLGVLLASGALVPLPDWSPLFLTTAPRPMDRPNPPRRISMI